MRLRSHVLHLEASARLGPPGTRGLRPFRMTPWAHPLGRIEGSHAWQPYATSPSCQPAASQDRGCHCGGTTGAWLHVGCISPFP